MIIYLGRKQLRGHFNSTCSDMIHIKERRQTLLVWLSYNSAFESIGVISFIVKPCPERWRIMMAANEEMFF